MHNLHNSFPDKSDTEIARICQKHYCWLADLMLESLKMLSASRRTIHQRYKLLNPEVFDKFAQNGQSIILVGSHYAHWELCGIELGNSIRHELYAIYHPLHSKIIDRLIYTMRTRFGNKLYTMDGTVQGMFKNRRKTTATVFISDQTPHERNGTRLRFLNQQTLVYIGAELLAKRMNYPVFYMSPKVRKRGYQQFTAELITETPRETPDNYITESYTRILEQNIRDAPPYWLWTHRRWKRT